jgi:NADH dehydrogenase
MLGGMIARRLLEKGAQVRILVRHGSDYAELEGAGAEPVIGDLKEPNTLAAACRGVRTVITTANSARRGPPDTVEAVDLNGNRSLVEAARQAGVEHFIFMSGGPATSPDSEIPFVRAKAETEARVRESGMSFTILRAQPYFEIWVGMVVTAPALQGNVVTYVGGGERKHSMISVADVAEFAVAAVDHPAARNQLLLVGGPEPISWRDAVAAFERALDRPIEHRGVPPDQPVPGVPQQIHALLASLDTYDSVLDTTELARTFGVRLTSVDEYARQVAGPAAAG